MATTKEFTELDSVSAATLSDIICAVQSSVSYQETLQQVYDLFATNIVQYYAGDPNGNLAGTTYQFAWDTTSAVLYVCTTTGTSSTAVWTSVTTGGSTGLTLNLQTTASATMLVNNSYYCTYAGTAVLTLPASATLGQQVAVANGGANAIGWQIAQNAGQAIRVGSAVSTTGTAGYLAATNFGDSITLTCVTAGTSTVWQAFTAPQGILTIN